MSRPLRDKQLLQERKERMDSNAVTIEQEVLRWPGVKGYISYPIRDQEDVSTVIEMLNWNHDRAKAAAGSAFRR